MKDWFLFIIFTFLGIVENVETKALREKSNNRILLSYWYSNKASYESDLTISSLKV